MKIKDLTDWMIMPQTIEPQGLIHLPGKGPNNRFDFKNKGNNKANEYFPGPRTLGEPGYGPAHPLHPSNVKSLSDRFKEKFKSLFNKKKEEPKREWTAFERACMEGGHPLPEDAAGVGTITKQNTTKDVKPGDEYKNVKKLQLEWQQFKENTGFNQEAGIGIDGQSFKFKIKDLIAFANKYPVSKIDPKQFADQIKGRQEDPKHSQSRAQQADLKYPIIVVKRKNGSLWIADGTHRAQKAILNNIQSVDAKIIPIDDMSAFKVNENFQLKEATVQDVIGGYLNSEIGKKYARYDCKTVTRAFLKWAKEKNIPTQVLFLAPPSAETIKQNPQFKGKSGTGDAHIMPVVSGQAIDFTVRQFPGKQGTPYEKPLITPVGQVKQVYNKLGGYYTDAPAWMNNKSDYLGSTLPPSIAKMDFGDELLENFNDKKVQGKSRPGRVKRAGASCKGSVSDLRAKAKRYGGERGKMYHWCANMKSGRKKSR
jgi:hypothetical protein